MFNRSSNTNSDTSFSASSNLAVDTSFNAVVGQPIDHSFSNSTNLKSSLAFSAKTGYTRFIFKRAENSGWSGDFITSDYYGIDELNLGAPYGQGVFDGIRHFNK
jgi:hypothetical protein